MSERRKQFFGLTNQLAPFPEHFFGSCKFEGQLLSTYGFLHILTFMLLLPIVLVLLVHIKHEFYCTRSVVNMTEPKVSRL